MSTRTGEAQAHLANRQTSATTGGVTTTYGYDGDGSRIQSTTPSGADLRYTWDVLAETGNPEIAVERTPSTGSLVRRYLTTPVGAASMTTSSATYYYHHDPAGSVADQTNASGTAQWLYEYDPYGAPRTTTNVSGTAPENRLQYDSQYTDPETGLYDLRARMYNPTTGVFGAVDPLAASISGAAFGTYSYANANPLLYEDPRGTDVLPHFCLPQPFGCSSDKNPPLAAPDEHVAQGASWAGQVGIGLGDSAAHEVADDVRHPVAAANRWLDAAECSSGQFTEGCARAGRREAAAATEAAAAIRSGDPRRIGEAFGPAVLSATEAFLLRCFIEPEAGSLGSTGRTTPKNLSEQLAMAAAKSDPAGGTLLPLTMTDPRWPASKGWVKLSQNVNGIEIHYVRNLRTGAVDDFKFKDN